MPQDIIFSLHQPGPDGGENGATQAFIVDYFYKLYNDTMI